MTITEVIEPSRIIPVRGEYDLIVCGAGPAGVSAAISAARLGLKTLLLERGGCLGGIWTSGMLCLVLDTKQKGGFLREIKRKLDDRGATALRRKNSSTFLYDVEVMKRLLDELCQESGVTVQLHSRVVSVIKQDKTIQAVVVESYGGREAFACKLVLDTSGNGDVGFLAGCSFDRGHPKTGATQPATLFAMIQGVPESQSPTVDNADKEAFRKLLQSVGADPSYQSPSLFKLPNDDLYCFMINHEYDVPCDRPDRITEATMNGRRELSEAIAALQKLPAWQNVRLVATADLLGLREGRRLRGIYHLGKEDIISGARFDDGICLVHFPVDIHSLDMNDAKGYSNGGVIVLPYHIPLRSLISSEISNLGFAGRCISGDFYAHASYRVTGNAVSMGEAMGIAAGEAIKMGTDFWDIDGKKISREMVGRGYEIN